MVNEDIKIGRRTYRGLQACREVVGAAVKEKNGQQYIVIYPSNLSKVIESLANIIPSSYRGNKVETELKGVIRAL